MQVVVLRSLWPEAGFGCGATKSRGQQADGFTSKRRRVDGLDRPVDGFAGPVHGFFSFYIINRDGHQTVSKKVS